jgi:hypothetical protein
MKTAMERHAFVQRNRDYHFCSIFLLTSFSRYLSRSSALVLHRQHAAIEQETRRHSPHFSWAQNGHCVLGKGQKLFFCIRNHWIFSNDRNTNKPYASPIAIKSYVEIIGSQTARLPY